MISECKIIIYHCVVVLRDGIYQINTSVVNMCNMKTNVPVDFTLLRWYRSLSWLLERVAISS